ncbi:hybrid sensor histidine kinase/response regulator [Gemmata sp. G18]|uniref:histidine kinase n=1 Tax=Gemmata palustris TaxID=2822762 RepID=A0ABS5BLI9_9BACT|nr:hybrid sensor histidine kinase/response regulator [Gemmata palustris]MBP3954569.1 hybrid sensor histidine kinase/response regulator [Gemmata palustris]
MSAIDASMFELFREEVKTHTDTLGAGLVAAESRPGDPGLLEELMRAAHSIKGAARIVNIDTAVRLAHVMEDALVAAQHGTIRLVPASIDVLLQGSDILAGLARLTPETITAWEADNTAPVTALEPLLAAIAEGKSERQPPPPSPLAPGEGEPPAGSPCNPLLSGKGELARETAVRATLSADNSFSPFPPVPAFERIAIPAEPLALSPDHSMLDLFREEAREHLRAIADAVPRVSTDPTAAEPILESLKQLRGAARLVKCVPVADAAGAVSEFIRATNEAKSPFSSRALDWTRYALATLAGVLATDNETFSEWVEASGDALATVSGAFTRAAEECKNAEVQIAPIEREASAPPSFLGKGAGGLGSASNPSPTPPLNGEGLNTEERAGSAPPSFGAGPRETPLTGPVRAEAKGAGAVGSAPPPPAESVVRVSANSLNRLMGLAGESLVQARWLPSFSTALLKLKKHHDLLATMLDTAYHAASSGMPPDQLANLISDARRQWGACRQELGEKTSDFDDHAARAEDLNARLYREVIASRMRPFSDGVHGFPRLARDMARALGKEVRFVIAGEATEVDRDILEKLESPLSHLIRNAIDHGLELPGVRTASNKPAVGTITVEARHRAGMLLVSVSDDGAGVDLNRLRTKIVERGLNAADLVAKLTEAELLEFLFLPGFSTTTSVTEFSGRGVGLDVVQDTIRKVGGNVRVATTRGAGTAFHLQLPLTLSVIRAVVIDVAGEPYAFPHTRIDRLVRVRRDEVRSLEHRQFVTVDGQNVGLVMAAQLLDMPAPTPTGTDVPVVLLSDGTGEYGLVVDSFRGEQDLVVRPLDPRLGKVPNLSAAAILDDGSPVLIVDVEDLFRSMDQFIQTGSLVRCETRPSDSGHKKRVLVVDDSITVREVERQLLLHKGYEVVIAVDGIDGWNKVRAERCDLLVSDIDMPRMNGLQLVQAVRADERLRDLPVIIVSYKEREEDRIRGLEVGANAYLTKSSFHDNRFIEAVTDLIGSADSA